MKKFTTTINGKEFVLFEGLLNEYHENGGQEIKTEIISQAPFIVQATVTGEKGTYQGIGDADETNTNEKIYPHRIRMAETRAVARALRLYNNIGMCSVEELGGEDRKEIKSDRKIENAKNILWKNIQEVAGEEPDEETILRVIADKTGVNLKNKEEITEEKARVLLDLWAN